MRFILLALLLSSVIGCANHTLDVQQGNIVTPMMLHRVERGMSTAQVINILGNPLLEHTFTKDRFDYVYTFQEIHRARTGHTTTVYFSNNRVTKVVTEEHENKA